MRSQQEMGLLVLATRAAGLKKGCAGLGSVVPGSHSKMAHTHTHTGAHTHTHTHKREHKSTLPIGMKLWGSQVACFPNSVPRARAGHYRMSLFPSIEQGTHILIRTPHLDLQTCVIPIAADQAPMVFCLLRSSRWQPPHSRRLRARLAADGAMRRLEVCDEPICDKNRAAWHP